VGLLFSEVATGEYLATGEDGTPADTRRHSLGYPCAIPGMFTPAPKALADVLTDAVVLGKDGAEGQIQIKGTEIKLGKTAVSFVALATLVDAELEKVRLTLNSKVDAGAPVPYARVSVAATVTKAK
jgi:hypothetical protein